MAQFKFKAIGTSWVIDISGLEVERKTEVLEKIMSRIDSFDKAYSRFRSDSTVTDISKKSGEYLFPEDSKLLFEVYYDLYRKTNGYFTPLVGQLLVDAGYDANYSLKQKRDLQTPPKWEEVMEFNGNVLLVKKPIQLDFGAAGKGYIIDLVGKVLEENDINSFCINAGGDILYKNPDTKSEPIRTGLENPQNTEQVIGICNLKNKSICGSAGNRRAWGNFTHIMNPHTLVSPTDITAVWIVADTALIADALTTCLFFVEPKTLSGSYSFEYVILYKDGTFDKSPNFPGELFTQ
jgi:thiamine biosynthesis lipoprotein